MEKEIQMKIINEMKKILNLFTEKENQMKITKEMKKIKF